MAIATSFAKPKNTVTRQVHGTQGKVVPGIEALVGRLIQAASHRYLKFDNTEDATKLPVPEPTGSYLLYLHIPFCVTLCPFCSFHRVEFKAARAMTYFDALQREIRLATSIGYKFGEVYIGGGTPTVMPAELVRTLDLVSDLHDVTRISAETNPDDLDGNVVCQLREAGINRLSVGVQSFDDELLNEMKRYDKYGSGAIIRQRLTRVRDSFDTLNVDMIFNFPHQTDASLQRDLAILTGEIAADQVSFYPLMATRTTRKAMQQSLGNVDFSRESSMYRQIADHMLASGYTRSSAWCFSRGTNMIDEYITKQDEYLGLGSGAFSFLGGRIMASTFSINHYIKLIEQGVTGIVRQRMLSQTDQMRYYLLMRLFSGCLDLDAADSHFGGQFRKGLRSEFAALRLYGAIQKKASSIRLTDRGYYLWVVMMREFFSGVNHLREQMRHNIARESEVIRTAGS